MQPSPAIHLSGNKNKEWVKDMSKIFFQENLSTRLQRSSEPSALPEPPGHQGRASHPASRASRGDKTSEAGTRIFVPSSIELEGTGVEELNHIKASKMNNDSYGHLLWLKTHKFLDIYNRSRVITKQTCLLWFQAYKMSADPRGHALIINIRKFTDPDLSERGGENCLP